MVDIKEKLAKGYVQSRAIIEIVGKPKEHVEQTTAKFVEKIKSTYDVITADISNAEELAQNPGFWGTFVEIELLAKDLTSLMGFCFDYMPSSVEVIAPSNFNINCNKLSNILNDLQGKLHNIDLISKQIAEENLFLKMNTRLLLKNFISILLFNTEKSVETLSKIVGMEKSDLEKFLDSLIKEKMIIKKGENYTLFKHVKREE